MPSRGFLDLKRKTPTMYDLRTLIDADPGVLKNVHQLTMDESRPLLGLRGNFGLYGTPEWWESIRTGKIRSVRRSGRIARLYTVGRDYPPRPNQFDAISDDGTIWSESLYTMHKKDYRRYQVGLTVDVEYALDELKARGADGAADYVWVVLTLRISE